MKRYVRSSEDLSDNMKLAIRKDVNRIIFWMWNDGPSSDIGGKDSTRYKTIEDYKNSDYSSLSKYVMDHKQDIFLRDKLLEEIDSYAKYYKDPERVRQEMLKIYDNYTVSDFARNLYLRRDDPKKK